LVGGRALFRSAVFYQFSYIEESHRFTRTNDDEGYEG